MLYQYIKRYLKNTYHTPSADLEWDTLENMKFFSHIKKRYDMEEFAREISEVKEAFKSYFEPVGKVIFRYKKGEEEIRFKILPYSIEPKDSKHLEKIVNIVKTNKKYIEYPFNGREDQIAIWGKIGRDINKELNDTDESVNIKELAKYAIRKALNLSERDVIVQLKRKYIIKLFDKANHANSSNTTINPEEKEEAGKANRFNGYTTDELEGTYKELFGKKKVDIDEFLQTVMDNCFEGELNFRYISNQYYEKNALRIIHTAIAKELGDYLSYEKDYILGFTGFVMRKHFYKIHELMAINLLERIYEKDTNANQFLLYYNGKTILKDNKKYVIPSLETKDGKQWNNSSLIGICNVWMNTKKKKEECEAKLKKVDKKLSELKIKLSHIQPEKERQEKKLADASQKYEKINTKYQELVSQYKYLEASHLNSYEYFSTKEQLEAVEKELHSAQEAIDKAKFNIQAIKDANYNTFTELDYYTNSKHQLLGDLKAQNSNIDSKSAQIDPIIESIIKVLMSRTKLMHRSK